MKKNTFKIMLFCSFVLLINCTEIKLKKEMITAQELSTWRTLDKGKSTVVGQEIIIEETDGADGYFLVSPKSYKGDIVLNYKVKALSESAVLIVLFSASDVGDSEGITLPPKETEGMGFWTWRTHLEHYNLTFNNVSHNYKPFFFKNISPRSKGFHLAKAKNIMNTQEWYDVEIGKQGNHLWFKLNGKRIFWKEDCNPLSGGHLIFRISGTTGKKVVLAKAALKNLIITHE